ncbi:MAG: hypothetical protein RIF32_13165 [Leptospirales bacterium]|jgi:hypothetical protein
MYESSNSSARTAALPGSSSLRRAVRLALGAGGLALIISVPLFAKPKLNPGGLSLSGREIAFLARCTLSRIDTKWIFAQSPDDGPGLVFGRRKIGMFLGGAQAARYDLPFFVCAGELAGTNWRYLNEATDERGVPYGGIATSMADLSGIPLFAPRQGDQRFSSTANHYNPAIIRWVRLNMIPDPRATVYDIVSYQEIYDEVFARAARILHTTDLYLRETDGAAKTNRFAVYLRIYAAADFDRRKRLRDEFTTVYRDEHLGPEKDPYEYHFSAGHAAAFWLRRGMDGTADEVRKLLREVLRKYDPEALKKN